MREKNKLTQSELAAKLNVSANMLRSKFYVCPVCGNVIHSMGEMTKNHYISFVAALSSDGMQIVKLYPEGKADCRVKIRGAKRIFISAIGTRKEIKSIKLWRRYCARIN